MPEMSPPDHCEYTIGSCDQDFRGLKPIDAFFAYPSQPPHLARTIAECVRQLKLHASHGHWVTWQDLAVGGQIIFCEICKSMRCAHVVVADITNTNFNVLFELGYAIGLKKPVLPVRDESYASHQKLIDDIGIFDALGYQPFSNSRDLQALVQSKRAFSPPIQRVPERNQAQPIFYIKAPVETDGSIVLSSCMKKGYFRFRTFDCREIPRLSLHETFKQVQSSVSVVAHLIDPARREATAHNARAAFACGMALAAGKHVLMLQESDASQPIDYRDVIFPYTDPAAIPSQTEKLFRKTADTFQSIRVSSVPHPKGLLERIDMGDVAAENEIQALSEYFVKTPQFQQVSQGHARLVVGRKGAGKTALFYGTRGQFQRRDRRLILDLKPEGHQFTRLREKVLSQMTEGLQLHTLTAFWHYLLLLETAGKILEQMESNAYSNPNTLEQFHALEEAYAQHTDRHGDFSERLMAMVNRLAESPDVAGKGEKTSRVTDTIYRGDIRQLQELVASHLKSTTGLWILFDNIDKGFPSHGLCREDVLLIRCLLEATRKLQRTLERQGIDFKTTVFLRRDVFDLLVDETPDRGKEPYANLDWSDTQLIQDLISRRMRYQAPELTGSFEDVWSRVFDPHIKGESSFRYMLDRTFLRPRDVLNFVRKCIQVAVSHGHERVDPSDVVGAEAEFSEDMLNELRYEMRDVFPDFPDVVLAFIGSPTQLSHEDIDVLLLEAGIPEASFDRVRDILLWFSFLGVQQRDETRFSYQCAYSIPKLKVRIRGKQAKELAFVIHPAFRLALSTEERQQNPQPYL